MDDDSRPDQWCQFPQVVREEVELIESMYLDQFRWLDNFTPNRSYHLSFQLCINGNFEDLSGHDLQIRVAIPPDYPTASLPDLTIKVDSISREDELKLNQNYKSWINSSESDRPTQGEICIDILVNKILELSSVFSTRKKIQKANEENSTDNKNDESNRPLSDHLDMAWSVFWMHHIKATGKRKDIVAWGRELEVRGWSKPGWHHRYPGALIIDGRKTAVQEYSNRLKSLRWKAIQQRHFEDYSIPFNPNLSSPEVESRRKIKKINPNENDVVVEVGSMSELLAKAQSSGLESEVLQILKIK